MTKPTGVAEAIELRASAYFRWEIPGKPVAVRLSLDVIDRLEREVIESFKAVTKRGSEVGGLLLGRAVGDAPHVVVVDDYESVPCDYSLGPLYRLAEADKARLEEAVRRRRAGPDDAAVVGFFRSNARKDLALDQDDSAVLNEYFADASNVCLLIKPFSMKPSIAGFFIWEEGTIQGESTYLQFPFKRAELAKGEFAKSVISGGRTITAEAPAPAARAEVSAPPPAAPKVETRAPLAPVIPKRDEAPPPPAAPKPEARPPISSLFARREEATAAAPRPEARAPVAPVIPKREEAPPPPPRPEVHAPVQPVIPKREEAPPPPPRPEAHAPVQPVIPKREEAPPPPPKPEVRAPVQPAPRRQEAAPAPVAAAKREERAAAAPAAAVEVKPAEIQVERRSRKLAYLLAAALLLILSAVGAFLYFNPVGRRSQEGAAADSAALALRAERNAGQLVLTWNREASQVKTAQRASLLIQDGDRKDDVELDLGILRSGSLGYTPVSNDVSFRLAVTDKQGKTISESFRVIAGRPSPAAPLGQPAPSKPESTSTDAKPRTERAAPPPVQAPQAASPPTDTQAAAPTPGGGAEPPPAATGEAKPPAPAPAKGESLAARLSAPTNLPEPPRIESQPGASAARPIETPVAAPPATQPAKPGPQQTAQPDGQQPATPVPGPAVSTPAPAEPLRVGGNVQQAKLLRQVTPAYPVLARQARISGVVQVEATVGRDGKVLKAAALNGPPLLRQAAVDAVRQWTYQPTTLNGQPVEVVTQVNVTFNLQR